MTNQNENSRRNLGNADLARHIVPQLVAHDFEIGGRKAVYERFRTLNYKGPAIGLALKLGLENAVAERINSALLSRREVDTIGLHQVMVNEYLRYRSLSPRQKEIYRGEPFGNRAFARAMVCQSVSEDNKLIRLAKKIHGLRSKQKESIVDYFHDQISIFADKALFSSDTILLSIATNLGYKDFKIYPENLPVCIAKEFSRFLSLTKEQQKAYIKENRI